MRGFSLVISVAVVVAAGLLSRAAADPGEVYGFRIIGEGYRGFSDDLGFSDGFGHSVAPLGDLDGDGIPDFAVGSDHDRTDITDTVFEGRIHILFMNSDGGVRAWQRIGPNQGGFTAAPEGLDFFGHSLAALGDVDGDGIPDLAAGAFGEDDGGTDRGAVYILFLRRDGTVREFQKLSSLTGGLSIPLYDYSGFGRSAAGPGDLDGDGVPDLIVGGFNDQELTDPANRGCLWICYLNRDGTVKNERVISDTQGGFTGHLDDDDKFGASIASLGDLDGDGTVDLAVGTPLDDDTVKDSGAVWILFMNSDGTVKGSQKISNVYGGLTGYLLDGDEFGYSVSAAGDLDRDGVMDLAVGEPWFHSITNQSPGTQGALHILLLNRDGTVKSNRRIANDESGFPHILQPASFFGYSVGLLGDIDHNRYPELAVGALLGDPYRSGADRLGCVYIVTLHVDLLGAKSWTWYE